MYDIFSVVIFVHESVTRELFDQFSLNIGTKLKRSERQGLFLALHEVCSLSCLS